MGRTPNTPTTIKTAEPLAQPEALTDAANVLAGAAAAYADERDLVNQLLGQAQMAGAFEDFSRTVRTSKIAFVKENKLYQSLSGKRDPNGSELRGTWQEFCQLLGMSVDKADMDIANLRAFGEDALESMSRMGIGYREMRQFRRLPEDEKSALIEVAKSGDKESFVELAEEIITKHAKEKDALTRERDDARAEAEAKTEVMDTTEQQLRQTKEELARSRKMLQTLNPDERIAHMRQELSLHFYHAETAIIGALAVGYEGLSEHDPQAALYMAGFVRQLELHLRHLRERYALPDALDEEALNWQDPEYQAQLAAQIEAQKPDWMKAEAEG